MTNKKQDIQFKIESIDDYIKHKNKYKKYAQAVQKIIKSLIKDYYHSGDILQIQAREKSIKSTREKLLIYKDIKQIKDLAGCRIIFYSNDGVERFLKSFILHKNFELLDHSPHYPVEEDSPKYIGNHFTLSLKKTELYEVNNPIFFQMKFEIQLQTILNHAWSEMSHDILYKSPKLNGMGSSHMISIQSKMKSIMTDYLIPAGFEFQNVLRAYGRLIAAKQVLDVQLIDKLNNITNLNDMYEFLRKIHPHISYLNDQPESKIDEVIEFIKRCISISKTYCITPIKIHDHEVPGRTYNDILTIALNILFDCRNGNSVKIFDIMVELYLDTETASEKGLIIEKLNDLAEYNLETTNDFSIQVQIELLARVQAWDSVKFTECNNIAIMICAEALKTNFIGSYMNHENLMFHKCNVPYSHALAELRHGAIIMLHKAFQSNSDLKTQMQIINHLKTGSVHIRNLKDFSIDFKSMILDNIDKIINFYAKYSIENLEIQRRIEIHLYKLHNILTPSIFNLELKQKLPLLISKINSISNLTNNSMEFCHYKLMIGADYIPPVFWKNNHTDINHLMDDKAREAKIDDLISEIKSESYEKWGKLIVNFSQLCKIHIDDTTLFIDFLQKCGKRKSEFSIGLLKTRIKEVEKYSTFILNGLLQSKNPDVFDLVKAMIDKNNNLKEIAFALSRSKQIDMDILQELYKACLKENDIDALKHLIEIACKNISDENAAHLKKIFISIINYFTENNISNWCQTFYFNLKTECYINFVAFLNENEMDAILASLISLNEIENEPSTEYLLASIAHFYPIKIIDFFGKRIIFSGSASDSNYTPVPYTFNILSPVFSKKPAQLLNAIKDWYNINPHLIRFNWGRIIVNIFPRFSKEIEYYFDRILKDNINDLQFVLDVLGSYNGEEFLYDTCKNTIINTANQKNIFSVIYKIMCAAGTYKGTYGRINALKIKRESIKLWQSDENIYVRDFCKYFEKRIRNEIIEEQKNADERTMLIKG